MKLIAIVMFLSLSLFSYVAGDDTKSNTTQTPNTPVVSREDSQITTDVKNKIAEDEKLRGLLISNSTSNGIVVLTGTAGTQDQIDRAVEIARKTPGVVSVTSRISILPTADDVKTPTAKERAQVVEKGEKELDEAADMSGDTRIATEINVKFAADDVVKSRNIRVESTNGVVILKGTVRSTAEETQAIDLANSVSGVREVRSELVIDPKAR